MKWSRICSECKHRHDFDPLVDECPFSQNMAECDRKLLKEIREGQGLILISADANQAVMERKMKKFRSRRPEVMPQPKPYYTHGDRYPDSIRISFADGHKEIYDRRISQPSPVGYVNNSRRGKA